MFSLLFAGRVFCEAGVSSLVHSHPFGLISCGFGFLRPSILVSIYLRFSSGFSTIEDADKEPLLLGLTFPPIFYL